MPRDIRDRSTVTVCYLLLGSGIFVTFRSSKTIKQPLISYTIILYDRSTARASHLDWILWSLFAKYGWTQRTSQCRWR